MPVTLGIVIRPLPQAPLKSLLDGLIVVTGWCGLILGIFGSLGLLYRRWTDPELRNYSRLFPTISISCSSSSFFPFRLGLPWVDPLLEGAKAYALGLLTGGRPANPYLPGQSVPGRWPSCRHRLLVAYIPLTHMSHMFMKYFLYHQVKWDDAPNRRGGRDRGRHPEEPGTQAHLGGKACRSGRKKILARHRLFDTQGGKK